MEKFKQLLIKYIIYTTVIATIITFICSNYWLHILKVLALLNLGIENDSNVDLQICTYGTSYTYDFKTAIERHRQLVHKYKINNDIHFVSRLTQESVLTPADVLHVYDSKWPVLLERRVSEVVDVAALESLVMDSYGDDPIIVTTVQGSLFNSEAAPMSVTAFKTLLNQGASDKHWVYAGDEWFLSSHPKIQLDLTPLTAMLGKDLFQLFPAELRPWGPMFLWGSPHSRSYLHVDPYNWTGLNFVIKGHKKWKLYPPGQDSHLKVTPNKRCGFPLECVKYNSELDAFDHSQSARFEPVNVIEVDQYAGDLLVIPTGWFHQAYNVEETMAVATQVMNEGNYRVVLEEVIKGGNVARETLPKGLETETPELQVATVMAAIPQSVLLHAQRLRQQVTEQILVATADRD